MVFKVITSIALVLVIIEQIQIIYIYRTITAITQTLYALMTGQKITVRKNIEEDNDDKNEDS